MMPGVLTPSLVEASAKQGLKTDETKRIYKAVGYRRQTGPGRLRRSSSWQVERQAKQVRGQQ